MERFLTKPRASTAETSGIFDWTVAKKSSCLYRF